MTNPVLLENDGKLILHPQLRFSNRFSETVKTNPVLSQDDAERILHQQRRYINRFSETVLTNAVLKKIEGKLTMHQKVPKWDDLPIFLVGFDHYLVRFAHDIFGINCVLH